MAFEVRGLCAAPYTPFSDDAKRAVDYDGIAEHVTTLVGQGVHYAFVNGTTGEGATMSVAERKEALSCWLKAAQLHPAGSMSIIAHVGAESIADTLDLAAHAEAVAAPAIAIICPTFNKPAGIPAIIELLEAVAAAAPTRPLYYYHIAIRTGVAIRCDALLEAVHGLRAAGRLSTFRGIKYSDADLHVFANCVAFAGGAYNCLYGKDEQLLGALAMGAVGAVGSTYNYQGREVSCAAASTATAAGTTSACDAGSSDHETAAASSPRFCHTMPYLTHRHDASSPHCTPYSCCRPTR